MTPQELDKLAEMMGDIQKDIISDFNNKIESKVKDKLASVGYNFDTKKEFFEFVKSRVIMEMFTYKPNYKEFYFLDDSNNRVFLFSFSDDVKILNDGSNIKITIG